MLCSRLHCTGAATLSQISVFMDQPQLIPGSTQLGLKADFTSGIKCCWHDAWQGPPYREIANHGKDVASTHSKSSHHGNDRLGQPSYLCLHQSSPPVNHIRNTPPQAERERDDCGWYARHRPLGCGHTDQEGQYLQVQHVEARQLVCANIAALTANRLIAPTAEGLVSLACA